MLGLYIVYLCTTSDHSNFSRSRDMVGAHQNRNRLRDLITTFSGMICKPRDRTCCVNMPAKLEVVIFTHYEDRNRDTKCGK